MLSELDDIAIFVAMYRLVDQILDDEDVVNCATLLLIMYKFEKPCHPPQFGCFFHDGDKATFESPQSAIKSRSDLKYSKRRGNTFGSRQHSLIFLY